MSVPLFDEIYKLAEERNITNRDWMRSQVKSDSATLARLFLKRENIIGEVQEGQLYMFSYNPKTKRALPYYDTLPLVFVTERDRRRFTGFNIHYLPPFARREIITRMQQLDERRIYRLIRRAKEFKPLIRTYLYNQKTSNFLFVPKDEWDMISEMQVENFRKKSSSTVWDQTRRLIK